uniref:Laminin N-terminal domain-containing protein n=1 Tax=Macrostomum lignano TaxID=282301 RepID=A0A1I8G0L7_9PLAT
LFLLLALLAAAGDPPSASAALPDERQQLQLRQLQQQHQQKQQQQQEEFGDRVSFANGLCHQRSGRAKFCQPQFENLAVNQPVVASSTCGSPPTVVCRRDESGRHCERCDASQPKLQHPPAHLTDYHVHGSCWISGPLSVAAPSANLTLSFHKKQTVYYMSITGCGTELPDAIEAYKSSDYGSSWQLWHLFSKNCTRDYGKRGYSYQFREIIQPREVICSDINIITNSSGGVGGAGFSVQQPVLSFSTNFNRASSGSGYERDPVIIDWMLATDLRLVLIRRPRTDGGSFPEEPFAFSNLDIGGRCFCNGHASRCVSRDGRSVCDCAHGTEGDDCERCKPFWVDLPWQRATLSRATECRPCSCNLHSQQCSFDQQLYSKSGGKSGGRCARCQHNTQGPHCESCSDGYYRDLTKDLTSSKACQGEKHSDMKMTNMLKESLSSLGTHSSSEFSLNPAVCNCHPLGSVSNTCDRASGKCTCKVGVDGDKCDRCMRGFEQTNDARSPCRRIGGDPWPPAPPPAPRPPAPPTAPPPTRPKPHAPKDASDTGSGGSAGVSAKEDSAAVVGATPRPGRPDRKKKGGRRGKKKRGRNCKKNSKCRSNKKKLSQTDYCIRDWALVVQVSRIRRQKRWMQIRASIVRPYRCPATISGSGCGDQPPTLTLWVRRRLWRCGCQRMRASGRYLLLTRDKRRRQSRQDLV